MAGVSRKGVLVVASQVVSAVLGLLVLLLVGRYLNPTVFGAYLFAVHLVGLVATLSQLGFGTAQTRAVARGDDLGRTLGVFGRLRTVLVITYVALFLLGLLVWHVLLDRGFTDATTLQVVLVVLAASALAQWRRVATATWRGQGRVHRIEWGNLADMLVFTSGVAAVALAAGSASGRWIPLPGLGEGLVSLLRMPEAPGAALLALYLAFAHLAGKAASLLVYSVWWIRDRVPVGPWDGELARRHIRFALPVAFTGMLSVLLLQTDILMIGYFWDSHEVGLYGAAKRLAKFGLLPTVALRTIVFPYFSHLLGRGAATEALAAFRQVEKYLLLFVVPLGVAMMVWADAGIHIAVGDSFAGASAPLRYLALWTIIMALGMPVRLKHLAAGNTRTMLEVMSINVGANLVLNLVFIPTSILGVPLLGLGAEGSAIATVLATTLGYVYNRWRARADFGVALFDGTQARLLAAGLGVAAAWYALRQGLAPAAYDRVYELGGIGLAGIALYAALLWLTGGLRGSDVRLLWDAIHPKGLVDEARGRGGNF